MASTVWQMTVCDALNAMRKAGTLCDTTIVGVDGTMLYAHACVLTAASPRIATYFKRTADSRYHLDIDWISGASWELLLKLLYCGAIDVDREEEIEHVRELTESFAIGILETTITHPQIKVEVIERNRCSGEIDQKNVHIDAYNNNDKNLDREKELLDFEKTDFDYSSQSGATLTDTTRFSRASITQTSYRSNVNNFQSNGNASEKVVLPAEPAVTNTCSITADVHLYPTDRANKTLELCQPLSAIDTQKKKVKSLAGSTYFAPAPAPVNSPWKNVPSVNGSTLKVGTTKCQRIKLSCDKCGKTFTSSSGLWKHALIHKDGRSHSCSYCGKQFNRRENMLRHQRAHAGVKPFKCSVCGKTFGHNISLARHQVIHTGDRPYSCDICGQTFSWKTSLTSHRFTHSRHKPHACGVCGRAFRTKQGLCRHMTVHTEARFSQNSNLESHRQTHTNVRQHRKKFRS